MKKFFCFLSLTVLFVLSGCFEITQETTINKDGSGIYSNTTDMSSMITMLKTMGGDQAKEFENFKKDTTISLSYLKDSLKNISDPEKKLLDYATLKILLDAVDEKMLMTFTFPYKYPEDMKIISGIMKKSGTKAISKQLESIMPGEEKDGSKLSDENEENSIPDLDKYFDYSYKKGSISKKLNKEKYATVSSDKGLKSMQEMSQMGTPVTLKTILNLPKPAKKAEGKGVTVSGDKKKITVETTIDDFFDHPEKFEYEIEY